MGDSGGLEQSVSWYESPLFILFISNNIIIPYIGVFVSWVEFLVDVAWVNVSGGLSLKYFHEFFDSFLSWDRPSVPGVKESLLF